MFSSQNSQVSSAANYIEDVFSTYLYTGTSSTQTITNGIDLAGDGGLVWTKMRNTGAFGNSDHWLFDTARGVEKKLSTNTTDAQGATSGALQQFNANGYQLGYTGGGYYELNYTGNTYASWTFRKQPKFFDIVTYTGNGASTQVISHLLGSAAGCVIVKPTNTTGDWFVYHASIATGIGSSTGLKLNTTGYGEFQRIGNVTSTTFEVQSAINVSGDTYVAYLFAHNAGGFGLTGTDNVITCGGFTGNTTVNLGYEPQWVLVKNYGGADSWTIMDNMRGMPVTGYSQALLRPNTSGAEGSGAGVFPTATGFTTTAYAGLDCIYIAIRRGPMKVPTSGTSVFAPNIYEGGTDGRTITSGFAPDSVWTLNRNVINLSIIESRLPNGYMFAYDTAPEGATYAINWSSPTGTLVLPTATSVTGWNRSGYNYVDYMFQRSPSFFDVVCYTGNSATPRNITHNLGAVPELILVKSRSNARGWAVYASAIGAGKYLILNGTYAALTDTTIWANTSPTSSVFTVGNPFDVNNSGYTYVAYLFATCAGVSKVGSYTGNGSSQTINCGFTGGARFVMIKATSTTGDWMVADSARGIVSGNDPYLELNNTNAEVTGEDWLDTDSTGFVVNQVSDSNANTNGVTYIYLAIA